MTTKTHLRPSVAEQGGYEPQHDPADIILDANENPYDLPESLKEEVSRRLNQVQLNRYPDSRSQTLREAFGNYLNVEPGRIVAGNGSDELIGYLLLACLEPGDRVVVAEPSFSMYSILANQYHAKVETVTLDEDWSLPGDMVERSRDASVLFLGSPNNPTGKCYERDRILELLRETSALVVVDEAYAEFSDDSLVEEVGEHDSLVVLRTLSKAFGLAGARVGFMLGPESIVRGINTVRLPYNLNSLSQVTGEVVLTNQSVFESIWETIVSERATLFDFLDELGFQPVPSDANFILFEPDNPKDLYEHLLGDGIRVRKFDEGRVRDYLRVTVGRPDENEAFRDSLKSYR